VTHRVVVVGGGFAGLAAVRGLRGAPVQVTLIDRRNFHLFQPLLYQVATGALTAGEIASPLRGILKHQSNAQVVLGEVAGFDLERRRVLLSGAAQRAPPPLSPPSHEDPRLAALDGDPAEAIDYDTLIVATGAGHAYFGHEEWRPLAPGLKSVEDATAVRGRILTAFEAAELENDPARRRAWMTFVVVGGGPTGVELAGQIAEIAHDTLARDFRAVDPASASILLVEALDRVLATFPARLSTRAAQSLERLGVTPLTGNSVVGIDEASVTVADGGYQRIPARTVIWAAGVEASDLARELGQATGAQVDRAGRVTVSAELTLPGHPEVLALGDMVRVSDPDGNVLALPGVAPVAMQEGRYAAGLVAARLRGRRPRGFRYRDKGSLATIGRLSAVADIHGLHLSGTIAWLTYVFVHLFYLVGLQNRVLVMIRWIVSFLTHGRGARLITGEAGVVPVPGSRPSG